MIQENSSEYTRCTLTETTVLLITCMVHTPTRVKCTKPLCVCELQLFYVGQVILSYHQIHKKKVPYISTWGNPQDKPRNIPIVHKVGADYWKCHFGALLLQL